MMEKRIEFLEKQLEKIIGEIAEVQKLTNWKFKVGNFSGGEKTNLDDSSWGEVIPAYKWSPAATKAWFRKKVVVPEEICGIKTRGSKADLALYLPVGGEVFVNGEVMAKDNSWLNVDFTIKERLRGGETFLIAIRTKKGVGYAGHSSFHLFIKSVNSAFFKLQLFLSKIKLISALFGLERKKIYREILEKITEMVDMKLLEERRIEEFILSIKEMDRILLPLSKEIKKYTMHLIGHAHIDMNWLWNWEATLNTARGTFDIVERFFREYPRFIFSQSQAALYSVIEENCPHIFENIRKRIKEGRWDVIASTWVEGDVNMVSGESLVRQILYAQKYIGEKFGVKAKVCWCPDTFGHPWTYPQILKKSGIDYYYAHRAKPSKQWPLFWWQSPDGSKVLVFNAGITYNNKISPELASELIQSKEKSQSNNYLVVYGVGNHGGGPTKRDLNDALCLQKEPLFPKIKFDTVEGFFKSAVKERKDYPVVKGELNSIFEGCYTTHADMKVMNRKGEALIFTGEILASITSVYGNFYPGKELEKSWKNLLFNQFHDILDGTSLHSSYDKSPQHASALFNEIKTFASGVVDNSLQFISQKIAYSGEGKPLLIFNPLSWKRQDVVKVKLKGKKETHVCDEKGNFVPSQLNGNQLIFLADVPALGYRTYYLREGKALSKEEEAVSVTKENNAYWIENRFFSIRIDRKSGAITNFFDKRISKEIISSFYCERDEKRFNLPANTFQLLYERSRDGGGNAWVIGLNSKVENIISGAKVSLVQKGPVQIVLKVEHRFNSSLLTQEITIYTSLPRIDFFTKVNWQEKGDGKNDAPMLKVAFPVEIASGKACFEIPFGYIYREADGKEVVALNWADISNEQYGVSLLNDCKYGYDVSGNTIRLTLIRSPHFPDPRSDIGVHRFNYSLYPHLRDWRGGRTVQAGYEFNVPLIPYYIHAGRAENDDGCLPAKCSFIEIHPKNLVLSAVKRAEDNRALILRVYESAGIETKGKFTFNFPFRSLQETDLLERPLPKAKKKYKAPLLFGKNEIKTFRLKW